jgi:hypothetical protein
MISTIENIFRMALARLSHTVTTFVPPLLAGLTILVVSFGIARLVRWLLNRLFKGNAVDRFLHQSGISSIYDPAGRLRATRIVSTCAYWIVLGAGLLTALNAFDTSLSSQIVETAVFLFPKLVTAGAILLAGIWLARYLSQGALVWASNEGIHNCRRLAAAVRVVVVFVAIVVAADHLNFARNVFLAAFILLVGGGALAASIAIGFSARGAAERWLGARRESESGEADRPVWHHL